MAYPGITINDTGSRTQCIHYASSLHGKLGDQMEGRFNQDLPESLQATFKKVINFKPCILTKQTINTSRINKVNQVDVSVCDNEIHTTSWEKLEGQVLQAYAQLQRKRSYRKAREKVQMMKREPYELLLDYPPSSSMEMETLMKRPEVALENAKDADMWKAKVLSMLETKFTSILLKLSMDVGCTNLHTVDLQVSEGNPVFIKQYTIPLKYQNNKQKG